jgi:hypothetical protein
MNPLHGEAALGEHKLVVNFNTFCSLEAAFKADRLKVPDLIVMLKSGVGFGFTELRTYVRVFLDKPMTDAEVGELITAQGMVDVKVPPELRKAGSPETEKVWAAAVALEEAVDRFLAPKKERKENPPLAA